MKNLKLVSAWFSLLLLTACSNKDLPKYNHLDSLRVLALLIDTPEVNPGDAVVITPWISDTNGAGRALTYTAAACLDPGISYGATPTCEGSASKVSIASGSAIAGLNAGNLYTGAVNTLAVTTPVTGIIFAAHRPIELYNGVAYIVTYTVSASDGTKVDSFRRIIVSDPSKVTKNANPTVTQILANGIEIAAYPGTAVNLQAVYGAGSAESYVAKKDDGSIGGLGTDVGLTESLTTTWFISSGATDFIRTIGDGITLFTPDSSTPAVSRFIAVTHDNRGGVGLKDYTL